MKRFLVLIMLISISAASNYVSNGDFEQALTVGWTQMMTGGGTTISRSTTYHPDPDYEVYLYKATGTSGYAQLWQVADIPTCNMDLCFSAKVYAWDNYSGAWAAAGVMIAYLDNADNVLGETRICQWSYDCPWINTPECHIIQVTDSLWHDYTFNIQDELANLPAVDPNEVAKIKVTLDAEVIHC